MVHLTGICKDMGNSQCPKSGNSTTCGGTKNDKTRKLCARYATGSNSIFDGRFGELASINVSSYQCNQVQQERGLDGNQGRCWLWIRSISRYGHHDNSISKTSFGLAHSSHQDEFSGTFSIVSPEGQFKITTTDIKLIQP